MLNKLKKQIQNNPLVNNIYDFLKSVIISLITLIGDIILLLIVSILIATFIYFNTK